MCLLSYSRYLFKNTRRRSLLGITLTDSTRMSALCWKGAGGTTHPQSWANRQSRLVLVVDNEAPEPPEHGLVLVPVWRISLMHLLALPALVPLLVPVPGLAAAPHAW
jgi:hypothetical protein